MRALTGACSSFTKVFDSCDSILKQHGIKPVKLSDFGTFENMSFENTCEKRASSFNRPTVTLGGKKYYEDELTIALANIKEVPSV